MEENVWSNSDSHTDGELAELEFHKIELKSPEEGFREPSGNADSNLIPGNLEEAANDVQERNNNTLEMRDNVLEYTSNDSQASDNEGETLDHTVATVNSEVDDTTVIASASEAPELGMDNLHDISESIKVEDVENDFESDEDVFVEALSENSPASLTAKNSSTMPKDSLKVTRTSTNETKVDLNKTKESNDDFLVTHTIESKATTVTEFQNFIDQCFPPNITLKTGSPTKPHKISRQYTIEELFQYFDDKEDIDSLKNAVEHYRKTHQKLDYIVAPDFVEQGTEDWVIYWKKLFIESSKAESIVSRFKWSNSQLKNQFSNIIN